MKILIRNIARLTTEAELLALFKPHGAVQSCSLVVDKDTGRSKGFGFVEMPKPGEAKAAIQALNGKAISGVKMRVKKAEAKKNKDADETLPDTHEDSPADISTDTSADTPADE